jgi:hypothetical protein
MNIKRQLEHTIIIIINIIGFDPRPTPSLLRVGMKLSDPDLLQTAEPLLYI